MSVDPHRYEQILEEHLLAVFGTTDQGEIDLSMEEYESAWQALENLLDKPETIAELYLIATLGRVQD